MSPLTIFQSQIEFIYSLIGFWTDLFGALAYEPFIFHTITQRVMKHFKSCDENVALAYEPFIFHTITQRVMKHFKSCDENVALAYEPAYPKKIITLKFYKSI